MCSFGRGVHDLRPLGHGTPGVPDPEVADAPRANRGIAMYHPPDPRATDACDLMDASRLWVPCPSPPRGTQPAKSPSRRARACLAAIHQSSGDRAPWATEATCANRDIDENAGLRGSERNPGVKNAVGLKGSLVTGYTLMAAGGGGLYVLSGQPPGRCRLRCSHGASWPPVIIRVGFI